MILNPIDVFVDGELTKIEFFDTAGNFVVQALWDDNDPQDSDHRTKFRVWAYRMVEQSGEYRLETSK